MLRVEFHPAAADELVRSKEWYTTNSKAVGERFFAEVEHAIKNISQHPIRWPASQQGIRKFYLKHFPYTIIYQHNDKIIRMIAVRHQQRKPGYWKRRT
jgi:toxin ParE1/3/4